jgi:hypothetical protein
MKFRSTLKKRSQMYVMEAPQELLENRRYVRVRGTIRGVTFRGYCGNAEGSWAQKSSSVLILSHRFVAELGLEEGCTEDVELTVLTTDLPEQKAHPELVRALAIAGVDLSVLPSYERRQHLAVVAESSSEEILQRRIEAVVAVCLELSRSETSSLKRAAT